jgi:pimeloyl-ACP methyl ester carboxylesterase
VQLHFVQRGAGPPILLVQGLGGDVVHWGEPFLGRLERRFAVTAYDHRGIGRSPRPQPGDPPFTIPDLAEDAVALLDHLGVETSHVLGLSMGGMVAQELALRHPGRLRTLTLAGTFAGGESALRTYPPMVQAIAGPLLRGGRAPQALAGMVAQQARQLGVARDEATLQTVLTQLVAVGGHDTHDRLGGLDVPTLVLHGERDPLIPVANGRLIAEAIPGARLEVVPRGGHVVFWERPEWCARTIAEFALGAAG